MASLMLAERPPKTEEMLPAPDDGGATQLRSSFFSPERVARHHQMIREMQGRMHGGHR